MTEFVFFSPENSYLCLNNEANPQYISRFMLYQENIVPEILTLVVTPRYEYVAVASEII